jgi:hypothetical protein
MPQDVAGAAFVLEPRGAHLLGCAHERPSESGQDHNRDQRREDPNWTILQ